MLLGCILCYQNEINVKFGTMTSLHVNENVTNKVKNMLPDLEKIAIWYHKIVKMP